MAIFALEAVSECALAFPVHLSSLKSECFGSEVVSCVPAVRIGPARDCLVTGMQSSEVCVTVASRYPDQTANAYDGNTKVPDALSSDSEAMPGR